MAVHTDREHFIPLRAADLIDVLCQSAGPVVGQQLSGDDRQRFRRFARAAASHIHARYLEQLKRLKDAYAPFDPDADTKRLREPTADERAAAQADLFKTVEHLLAKANYTQLPRPELERVMQGASDWGVDMEVCWDCFDRLDVFIRGKGFGKRVKRRWYPPFRTETVSLPTFGRVVVVLKQRPHRRLGADADTVGVFLKLFKDIPQVDVEMLLPGTQVKMPLLDRFKLGSTVTSSVGYGYKT